jgi:hypothetical protein
VVTWPPDRVVVAGLAVGRIVGIAVAWLVEPEEVSVEVVVSVADVVPSVVLVPPVVVLPVDVGVAASAVWFPDQLVAAIPANAPLAVIAARAVPTVIDRRRRSA